MEIAVVVLKTNWNEKSRD